MASFAHYTTPASTRAFRGGYADVFLFCPIADFTSIAPTTASPSALGDIVSIVTAHTFTSTKGFFSWDTQQQTVTLTSETVGDVGAQLLKHTVKFNILGDSASNQEQLQNILNAKTIALVKDSSCVANQYIQLGDSCIQPIYKVTFNGATTKEGSKIYDVSVEVTDAKYFYTASVTKAS